MSSSAAHRSLKAASISSRGRGAERFSKASKLRPASSCWIRACRAGGQNKGNAARAQRLVLSQLRPVLGLLIRGMDEVYRGVLEPSKYPAMASGASAVCKLFALAELEERLLALER